MKFKLLSDLHLEFYRGDLWYPTKTNEDKDTVLLLAGDIHVGTKAVPWITEMCTQFKHVVYILGNHEFYGYEWYTIKEAWQTVVMPKNFTFLDDDICYFGNTRVIGGTLWTDVTDPFEVWNGQQQMNDYRVTKIARVKGLGYDQLRVHDTTQAHLATVAYIKKVLEIPWGGKTIVMTHHLPTEACTPERFKGNMINAFFATELSYIMENFNIDVWVHGHTHDNVDIDMYGTRILCNPAGYHGREMNPGFKENLVFNV